MSEVGKFAQNIDMYKNKAGQANLEKLANEYAAPKPGSLEFELRHLRNPQLSSSYQRKEGFDDLHGEGRPLDEVLPQHIGNGVESHNDGTFTLRSNGQGHRVNSQGVPTEPVSDSK